MTTAKKLEQYYPVLTPISFNDSRTVKRMHPLLRESQEIFEMMGWGDLSEKVKLAIAIDLIGFRDELAGLYSTNDPRVLARRKSIYYWINMLLDGTCTEETALDILKVVYLA